MTYSTKHDFMEGLREAIGQYDIPDAREILLDFEQHFTDGAAAGETEEDVCRKLGDVEEIAKQYVSDDDFAKAAYSENSSADTAASAPLPQENSTAVGNEADVQPAADTGADASGFDTAGAPAAQAGSAPQAAPQPVYQAPQQQGFKVNGGAVTGVILVDLFVFTWAIPTLLSLIIALMSISLSFAAVGAVSLFGGITGFFFDISGMIVTGFAPVSLIFLGIMMIGFAGMLVIASIGSVKGFIGIIRSIINWHSRTFVGYDVFRKEQK